MINEYETQSTLNPKLWEGDALHPTLRVGFMKIAKAFYEFLEVKCDIEDVIIIGSSANYNWTEHSDIDLHVVINYLEVGDNMHLVSNYMHAKKSIWNMTHPLTYKGMNIELYAQDVNENLHSTVGVYSVMRGKWLSKPSADTVSIDDAAIEQKAQPYEYDIKSLKKSDPHIERKIKNIKQRLQNLRQSGLDANGEYSIENMAFKHLRNKGYLELLKHFEKSVTMDRLKVETTLNEADMADTMGKAKGKVKKFIDALKTEKDETKQAMIMLLQHINGEKLSAEEWKWVRGQLKDVVKLLGLTAVAIVPGGSLVAILAKALKLDKHMLPSSFQKPEDEREITEALLMHVTRKRTLDAPGWANIIKKTGGVIDPEGQWKHPGCCTMIPTTNGSITMRNVAHPVLGIDETGHMLMMRPEHDYQFPGRNVFEIPHTAQWQTMIMQLRNRMNNGSIDAK
jgi:hypothetical protein